MTAWTDQIRLKILQLFLTDLQLESMLPFLNKWEHGDFAYRKEKKLLCFKSVAAKLPRNWHAPNMLKHQSREACSGSASQTENWQSSVKGWDQFSFCQPVSPCYSHPFSIFLSPHGQNSVKCTGRRQGSKSTFPQPVTQKLVFLSQSQSK